MRFTDRRRRVAGVVLFGYGAAGTILAIVGLLIGLEAAGRVERVVGGADATLATATATAHRAAEAFAGFGVSVERASQSASHAAQVSRDVSSTMNSMAGAMSITVFGSQPLAPLSGDFRRASSQLATLGDDLTGIADSLGRNRADLATLRTDLERLASQLDATRGVASPGEPPLRLAVVLLVAWIALQSGAALAAGAMLWRG